MSRLGVTGLRDRIVFRNFASQMPGAVKTRVVIRLSYSETAETACTIMLKGRFRCIVIKKCGRDGREQGEIQPIARANNACEHFLQHALTMREDAYNFFE